MTPLSAQALELQQPQTPWDSALEGLLWTLLAFSVFAFGSRSLTSYQLAIGPMAPNFAQGLAAHVMAASREVVLGLAALATIVLALKLVFRRDTRFVWSWAYVPIVLFLALVLLQLAPLPAKVVASLSPNTVATKTRLLGDLPGSASFLKSMTLTFYSLRTWRDFRLVLAVSAVFVVTVNLYRRPDQIKRLLAVVAGIGAATALLAAYQNATAARVIYSSVPMAHLNSGPFLNHSHFGQFMNLCIGAMLGLLAVRLGELAKGVDSFVEFQRRVEQSGSGTLLALIAAIALSTAVIFLSLTRGGIGSMFLAGIFIALLFAWRRAHNWEVVVALIVGALLLGVMYASLGSVYQRLTTLRHVASDNGSRWQVLKDLSRSWKQFPLFGTGLGTHQFVFPMFDSSALRALSTHAENEYGELMEECGVVGVVLCLTFLAVIVFHFIRCVWNPRRSIHLAAFGIGYGLIAVMVHSFTDFGQHDPAIACLTASFCGLLVCLSRMGRRTGAAQPAVAPRRAAWWGLPMRVGAALAVIVLWVAPLRAANTARRAQIAWGAAQGLQDQLAQHDWSRTTDREYFALDKAAADAVRIQPRDVTTQYLLALFRWRAVSRSAARVVVNADVRQFTRHIINDLDAGRRLCPTFGHDCALAGQLQYFVLGDPAGAQRIRLGYDLDKNFPASVYQMAALDIARGQWDQAMAMSRRTLLLDPSSQPQLLAMYVDHHRAELAYALVKGNGAGLSQLAEMLGSQPDERSLAEKCEAEARRLLLAQAARSDAPASVYAEAAALYSARGDDADAIDRYERALARDYGQVDWRMNLANLLMKNGHADQAVREAEACLRLRPDSVAAKAMIESREGR